MNRLVISSLGCLLLFGGSATLHAQTMGQATEQAASDARVHLGPLAFTPRISIRNVGVDTNVYNDAARPVRDFTATFGPAVDSWLRFGKVRVSSTSVVEWVHFGKASEHRAFNISEDAELELALHRVVPYVGGGYGRTRQRLNLEIDDRIRQERISSVFGVYLRLGARVSLDARSHRVKVNFGESDVTEELVADALNRTTNDRSLAFRFAITPLTTFVVRTAVSSDRFEFRPERDNDSFTLIPGFELKRTALISGKVDIGLRRFKGVHPTLPDFTGLVAAVDAAYIMREMTRFGLRFDRNVHYSVETTEPYYVQTGGGLTLTQVLGGDWYVEARFFRTQLVYQKALDIEAPGALPVVQTPTRTDLVATRGVGIGRRLGTHLRIGFDVDYGSRKSTVPGRTYDGFKFGGSFTYGS